MDVRFTPRELDIMAVLWTHGPATVAEVREALSDELAHNTVLTMLKVMQGKGYVSRRREGRTDRYTPEVKREVAGESALSRVTKSLFGGSPSGLLLSLVESDVGPDELRRMRDLLDRRLLKLEDEQ